ncbi:hypothetical protein R50073_49810 (plasmid) [Maricurvus nonylphenolicus]|uniref:hypothetical protein n=1 Tax=Maricurvus nonylphenolicus TaxID=1008307 RepID=UPI0036F20A12
MKGIDLKNEYPVRDITIRRVGCKPQYAFSMSFRADHSSTQACLMSAEAAIRSWGAFDKPEAKEKLELKICYMDGVKGQVSLPFNEKLRMRRLLVAQIVYGYRVNSLSTGFMIGDPLDSEAEGISASICA